MNTRPRRARCDQVAVVVSPRLTSITAYWTGRLVLPASRPNDTVRARLSGLADGLEFRVVIPPQHAVSSVALGIVQDLRNTGVLVAIAVGIGAWLDTPSSRSVIGLVVDHINLSGENPLIGYPDPTGSPRFIDASNLYSTRLIELAEDCAAGMGIPVRKAVFAECPAQSGEISAQAEFAGRCGAEALGTGIAPLAIAAAAEGIETLAFFAAVDADWLETSGVNSSAPAGPGRLPDLIESCIRRIPSPPAL